MNDPRALRKVYFDAWQKSLQGASLSPMEAIIVDVIQRHPEYQPIFARAEHFEELQEEAFALDHNPFFHLGLHVTVIEQVNADRPTGIRSAYQRLMGQYSDPTVVEHKIMKCLAKVLMEGFRKEEDFAAQEVRYLEAVKRLN